MKTAPYLTTFFLSFIRLVFRQFRNPTKPLLRPTLTNKLYQKFSSLNVDDQDPTAVIIDVEGALLKSTCLFPYFMIVAFEAGSFVRAILLFLLYPILGVVGGGEMAVKLMVFVSFFGLRKDGFNVGRSVLPKFLLDDVGLEAFEAVKNNNNKKKRKVVGVCGKLPRVMVESFLKDYLEFDHVVAGDIKVVGGYFLGTLEDVHNNEHDDDQSYVRRNIGGDGNHAIGIARFNRNLDGHPIFQLCKEIYLVTRKDKKSWRDLPPHMYPNPLIFHDGRLAVRPTFVSSLVVFIWTPFALLLALLRLAISLTLPFGASIPVLTFLGFRTVISGGKLPTSSTKKKGQLYVCNHRTLLDPLYLSFTLKTSFTAVTYSISRVSEILSPIRTVRLSRDRDRDAEMMEGKLLSQQDLVVCPEGTTCREPYLLRFSPLFAELTDEIVPVALDAHVDMFYGTTASGLKCLDPLFFLLNPRPEYSIRVLDPVSTRGASSYEVANFVQGQIGKVLGFQCTKLTRKDKYLVLAGNEGIHKRR
ncbi:Probable glycerol-3-phosphate acyltransferase 3 [Linum grandiflorum]